MFVVIQCVYFFQTEWEAIFHIGYLVSFNFNAANTNIKVKDRGDCGTSLWASACDTYGMIT